MIIDFKGHNGLVLGTKTELKDCNSFFRMQMEREMKTWALLQEALKDASEENKMKYHSDFINVDERCLECGKRMNFRPTFDGCEATTVCEYSGGIQPYSVILDVPSGKIVFGNDFRSFVVCDDSRYDVNAKVGKKNTTEAYARVGLVHIFVGNTCPRVYKNETGLTVESRYEPDYDEKSEDEVDQDSHWQRENESLGSICTDLWWFSAMDYDHFMRAAKEEDIDLQQEDYFIVDVEIGSYAFSDNFARHEHGTENCVYSHIQKLETRTPLVTKTREYGNTVATSHFAQFRYGESFRPDLLSRLDYQLLVSGNGLRWIKGVLSDQNRCEDRPFVKQLGVQDQHFWIDHVPIFTNDFSQLRINQIDDRYNLLVNVPLDVDEIWLAVLLMYVKTLFENINKIEFFHHSYVEKNEQMVIMRRMLAMLCSIAEQRGLLDVLPRHFADLQEMFPS